MDVETVIALAGAGWLFAEGATPIQWLKGIVGLANDSIITNRFKRIVRELINCSLCASFWIAVAYTMDWKCAVIVSLLSESISRLNKATTT